MGSKKKVVTKENSTQTSAPPSWTMPGIADASAKVTEALAKLPAAPYMGDFVAVRSPEDLAQIKSLYGNASNTSMEMEQLLRGGLGSLSELPAFSSTLPALSAWQPSDPMDLTNAVKAATHPVTRQLMEEILPSIKSSALESGAYTGDRAMSVLPTTAIGNANEAAQRIAAQLAYEDYQQRENRSLQAWDALNQGNLSAFGLDTQRGLGIGALQTDRANLLPQLTNAIMQMSSTPGDIATMLSNLTLGDQQAGINNDLARYNFDIQQPFMGLDIATDLLARLSGSYGTINRNGTSTQTTSSSGLGNVVQGIAGLAGMVGSLPMGGGASLGGNFLSSLFKPQAAAPLRTPFFP